MYKNDKVPEYKKKNPEMKMKEITSIVSKDWNSEKEDVKKNYNNIYIINKKKYILDVLQFKKIYGNDIKFKKTKKKSKKQKAKWEKNLGLDEKTSDLTLNNSYKKISSTEIKNNSIELNLDKRDIIWKSEINNGLIESDDEKSLNNINLQFF